MADDPDPPRVFYDFKPKNFERANELPGTKSSEPTDVRHHLKIASSNLPEQRERRQSDRRANEVHAILKRNVEMDKAAGLYDIAPGVDTRKARRLRRFWIPLFIIDSGLAYLAYSHRANLDLSIVVVLSGGALLNLMMVWQVWAFGAE